VLVVSRTQTFSEYFQVSLALSPTSVLCLAVVASTQQIASAMCVANSLQKKHCLESCVRAKEAYHAYFGVPIGGQE